MTGTAFILFFGSGGPSAIEAQLDRIRIAIGSGTLRRAAAAGFAPLIAVTADPAASWVGKLSGGLFVYAMSILDAYKTARIRAAVAAHQP